MRSNKKINKKYFGLFALLATAAVFGTDQEAPARQPRWMNCCTSREKGHTPVLEGSTTACGSQDMPKSNNTFFDFDLLEDSAGKSTERSASSEDQPSEIDDYLIRRIQDLSFALETQEQEVSEKSEAIARLEEELRQLKEAALEQLESENELAGANAELVAFNESQADYYKSEIASLEEEIDEAKENFAELLAKRKAFSDWRLAVEKGKNGKLLERNQELSRIAKNLFQDKRNSKDRQNLQQVFKAWAGETQEAKAERIVDMMQLGGLGSATEVSAESEQSEVQSVPSNFSNISNSARNMSGRVLNRMVNKYLELTRYLQSQNPRIGGGIIASGRLVSQNSSRIGIKLIALETLLRSTYLDYINLPSVRMLSNGQQFVINYLQGVRDFARHYPKTTAALITGVGVAHFVDPISLAAAWKAVFGAGTATHAIAPVVPHAIAPHFVPHVAPHAIAPVAPVATSHAGFAIASGAVLGIPIAYGLERIIGPRDQLMSDSQQQATTAEAPLPIPLPSDASSPQSMHDPRQSLPTIPEGDEESFVSPITLEDPLRVDRSIFMDSDPVVTTTSSEHVAASSEPASMINRDRQFVGGLVTQYQGAITTLRTYLFQGEGRVTLTSLINRARELAAAIGNEIAAASDAILDRLARSDALVRFVTRFTMGMNPFANDPEVLPITFVPAQFSIPTQLEDTLPTLLPNPQNAIREVAQAGVAKDNGKAVFVQTQGAITSPAHKPARSPKVRSLFGDFQEAFVLGNPGEKKQIQETKAGLEQAHNVTPDQQPAG